MLARALQSRPSAALAASRALSAVAESWQRTAPPGFTMTKIVSTIGPASGDDATIQGLVDGGMRIMRLNFSHNNAEEARPQLEALRGARGKHANVGSGFNLRAALLDTQGPEIRTGVLADGAEEIALEAGAQVTLTTDPAFKDASTAETIFVTYPSLGTTVEPGSVVLLDDGLIELRVTGVQQRSVQCDVVNSGRLGSRKGVNLPGAGALDLPAMSAKDRADIRFGVEMDVEFIAASFVRKGSDVREIRGYIDRVHEELWPLGDRPPPRIISKIENEEALRNFDAILRESDGIMVARGDLGVEIPMEFVTRAQKSMIRAANIAGKPIITATQMLESMVNAPRPTRAEVSDVINAVHDGTDAVMLSGETAKGRFPLEAIRTMHSICSEADRSIGEYGSTAKQRGLLAVDHSADAATQVAEGVALAAVKAAKNLDAAAIIVMAHGGTAARLLAKHRPNLPIMAFCDNVKVGRQLILHRGVHPVLANAEVEVRDPVTEAIRRAKELGFAREGDTVIVVAPGAASTTLQRSLGMNVAVVK